VTIQGTGESGLDRAMSGRLIRKASDMPWYRVRRNYLGSSGRIGASCGILTHAYCPRVQSIGWT